MSHQQAQEFHPAPNQKRLIEVAPWELAKLQGGPIARLADAHDIQLAVACQGEKSHEKNMHSMGWEHLNINEYA